MNDQETILFPVSLSLSISPQEADAGTALTLKAVAECPEQYDLSGDPVLFLDATGHEVGKASLAALEGNDFGAEITVTAPIELGEHGYSTVLMPADGDGVAHVGARAEARCRAKAHDVHINAWDIPSAIAAGDAFSFHVGIKCSGGCKHDGGAFTVRDEGGTIVASGRLPGAIWPGSSALQCAEVRAVAPPDIGLHDWTVEFAGSNSGIAHSPGSLSIPVRTVAAPDHEITIEVVDRESGAPLEGVNLIMHPYRTTTDRNGMARMKVAADHYLLHASGLRRVPYRDHLDATRPVELRILMAVEQQPESHWTPPVKPQEPSIAQVLR
jgi:hypothetical protein